MRARVKLQKLCARNAFQADTRMKLQKLCARHALGANTRMSRLKLQKICARHAHPLRQRRVSILQLARVRGADTEARKRSPYSKLRRAPLSSAVARALTEELESA